MGAVLNPHCGKKSSLLLCLLILFSTGAYATPSEDTNFLAVHQGTDFPVAWIDVNSDIEYRLYYPGLESGENANAAGNGPFPWMVFIAGEYTGTGNYEDISSSIVSRGYIVMVIELNDDPEDEIAVGKDIQDAIEEITIQNNVDPEQIGIYSQIDENHWVISGHGLGSHSALEVYGHWGDIAQTLELDSYQQPPRGVFGLGHVDGEYIQEGEVTPSFQNLSPPTPAIGLFITGTADGIADAQTEILPLVNSNPPLGMHLMSVVGANHRQYAEWPFLQGAQGDNAATMTKEEQINHASEHIIPFLDLVSKGDHNSFRQAFNREVDSYTVSDSDAYTDENLNKSKFINGELFQPSDVLSFGPQSDIVMQVNWSMRDNSTASSVNQNLINISCWLYSDYDIVTNIGYGEMSPNSTTSCTIPSSGTQPGWYSAVIEIMVDGAPTRWTIDVQRSDGPMWTYEPYEDLQVPQGGWAEVDASQLAVDPDGQIVRITSAEVNGSMSDFSVEILDSGTRMRVYHTAPDTEDLAPRILNISLKADGQYDDRANISMNLTLVDANNQLIVLGQPSQIRVDEDSQMFTFDVNTIVSDPENFALDILLDGESSGQSEILAFSVNESVIEMTPLENKNGVEIFNLSISDQFNDPVLFELVVTILPIDDPILVNYTSLDLEFQEDGSTTLDVSTIAYDPDGGSLIFTATGTSSLFEYSLIDEILTVVGNPDVNGNGILNLSFSKQAQPLNTQQIQVNISVAPVDDQVGINILEFTKIGPGAYIVRWLQQDLDGVGVYIPAVYKNGEEIISIIDTTCNEVPDDAATRTCTDTLSFEESGVQEVVFNIDYPDTELGENRFEIPLNYSQNGEYGVEEETSSNTKIIVILGLVNLIIVGLAVAFFIRKKDTDSIANLASQEEEVVEQSISESSGSGLLARARNQQKP